MTEVILESEGPFNRRKKTCTLYPVIYGSEVLVFVDSRYLTHRQDSPRREKKQKSGTGHNVSFF